ncbi:unnamed protein product [marine sediment metagenome]|uniref:Uncharacterized protein n=1 Tax=marine sediment metagenome TaxID=412755 RepID=X1HR44_9ZZZZ
MIQPFPNYEELLDKCAEYVKVEQGDTNYEVAHKWIEQHWGDAVKVAGGIRILEETWNRAFYSRGIFDMQEVIQTIEQNRNQLNQMRLRHIETFSSADEEPTRQLWDAFFEALKPRGRNVSPYVATAKALHLLAPNFLVAFDSAIAQNYGCSEKQPQGYIKFQHLMAELACHILDTFIAKHSGNRETARVVICGHLYLKRTGSHYTKSLAKLLDEYNWIARKE